MLELKKLSAKFEEKNPDITLKWVIVEENILRQRVTTDVSTGRRAVRFGVSSASTRRRSLPNAAGSSQSRTYRAEYDLDDVFKPLRDGLSYDGKLFALPFYGESSFLMYRKDLFEAEKD